MNPSAAMLQEIYRAPSEPITGVICRQDVINLRYNPVLDEAEEIALRLVSGTRTPAIAEEIIDLNAFAVGTMIAKMANRGFIPSAQAAFAILREDFPREIACRRTAPARINRRTVVTALQSNGILDPQISMKEIKPVGSNPSVQTICNIVHAHTGVTYEQIMSINRKKPLTMARFTTIWILRYICGHSLTAIGNMIGGRDHTSIINAIDKIYLHARTDPENMSALIRTADICDLRAVEIWREVLLRQGPH